MMKITFLGTGTSQGVPVLGCSCGVCRSLDFRDKRLRTSVHLAIDGQSIVFDAGPDFRQQLLQNQIQTLDAVVFTHEHQDHIAGLDDVRPFNYIQKKPTKIYATEAVQTRLHKSFDYAFASQKYPGVPQLDVKTITNAPFQIGPTALLPIEVKHYKMPVFGFRIKDFTYITDANFIAPEELDKARGSEVLVLNALRREKHISHFTLAEALEVIEEVKPKKAYLTHLSHLMGLHQEVTQELPSHVHLAFDGLELVLD